jgi:hypothetical protein
MAAIRKTGIMDSLFSINNPIEGDFKRMANAHRFDQDTALDFFRTWLKTHKYVQYLFFLSQDKKSLEIRRTKDNRYIGIIELYQGKYYLEFYSRAGEWCTDQKALIPLR